MEEQEPETDPSIVATLAESIGFQRIDIALDHPQKVYYCGHQISGNVHLDLQEPVSALDPPNLYVFASLFAQSCSGPSESKKPIPSESIVVLFLSDNCEEAESRSPLITFAMPSRMDRLRLKCKGEAQVYFTDRSAGIRRKFSAFENYLHEETYLVGDGKEKSMITGGVYPFSLTLPENLPCSFEGRYGRVRYSIRALLDVTTIYRFSTNIIPFTVAPILDLNRDPLAPLPINIQQSKVYMGQTEPLSMSMFLPVHGYVPGQAIPINIAMNNPTSVVVKKIRVVFKKVVSYHSTEKSRKHKEIVVEVAQPVNKASDTYDVTFDVPAVPPTGMIHCNIIDVLYTLKVEACVDVSEWYYRMFQKNLKLRTNIVVGTVPLQNYETPQKTADVTEAFSFHPPCTSAMEEYASDTSPLKNSEREETARPSLSLPLYEKSQIYRSSKPDRDDPTGDEGDSDGEVKPYSPMYRVYKFEPSKEVTLNPTS